MFVKNVAVDGSTARSALIDRGRIVDFPDRVEGNIRTFDGRGGRLISGLTDHHLHLFATVAQGWSLDLSSRDAQDAGWLADRLQDGASKGPVRGVGYSGEGETLLDRWAIDSLCSAVPVKLQYRTGGLWVLNSLALDLVLTAESEAPPAFERNDFGQLTGRVWRGDRFLRERWLTEAPDFESLGAELASWGVTSVTDASVTTDQAQVAAFEKAARRFPQRIQLMSGGCIVVPDEFTLGPVKIMLDEHALPELGVVLSKIEQARRAGRTVAAHCVTQAELALMLCAFETAGASPGDRIEHGAIITQESIAGLCALGITVVSQPAFIHSRGDRYVREIPAEDLPNLYRLRSLQNAGVKLAASSDAPYGPLNPWLAIRTATNRRSADDVEIGGCEKLAPREALDLYLSPPDDPGSAPRRPRIGEPADLCLMNGAALGEGLDPVMMTLIAGHPVYMADSMRPVSGPEAM
jgi:predicted amidohydrolase YtcJ